MNEKEKIKELIHKIGSKYMQGYGSELKWYKREIKLLQQHDQLILREFVEWNVKDVVGNDPKAIKDSLKRVEQFMKRERMKPLNWLIQYDHYLGDGNKSSLYQRIKCKLVTNYLHMRKMRWRKRNWK